LSLPLPLPPPLRISPELECVGWSLGDRLSGRPFGPLTAPLRPPPTGSPILRPGPSFEPPVDDVGLVDAVAGGVGAEPGFELPADAATGPPAWPPRPPAPGPSPAPRAGPPLDADRPAAARTGATEPGSAPGATEPGSAVAGSGFAALSPTLGGFGKGFDDEGQALNETSPTRVMKPIAAPASRAPDAPIPTMKLSDVLLAARVSPSRAARQLRALTLRSSSRIARTFQSPIPG
jgi:hypothetical protein